MVAPFPKRLLILVLTVFMAGVSWIAIPSGAAELVGLYGEENTGTSGGQFLRIPVGARSVALAKAFTALATDGSAPYWNAAGIVRTPGRTNFFASHSQYTADIGMDYLAVHHREHGDVRAAGLLKEEDDLLTVDDLQLWIGYVVIAPPFPAPRLENADPHLRPVAGNAGPGAHDAAAAIDGFLKRRPRRRVGHTGENQQADDSHVHLVPAPDDEVRCPNRSSTPRTHAPLSSGEVTYLGKRCQTPYSY